MLAGIRKKAIVFLADIVKHWRGWALSKGFTRRCLDVFEAPRKRSAKKTYREVN
jgi:hypothetical protein